MTNMNDILSSILLLSPCALAIIHKCIHKKYPGVAKIIIIAIFTNVYTLANLKQHK